MLTKEELDELKKALPKKGLHRIAEQSGYSYATVQRSLCDPKRYNRQIIEATIQVVEQYKNEVAEQKLRLLEAVR